jgi:sugar-specific transcriptional regulator TrmB
MPYSFLTNLGLNDNEILVYIACLQAGKISAGSIAARTKINRSTVYVIIEKMLKNGYLSVFIRNNTKYFSAIDPESLIERKKNAAEYLLNQLKGAKSEIAQLKENTKNAQKIQVEYYSGINGLKNLYDQILKLDADIDSFEDSGEMYDLFPEYVDNWIKLRVEKGIKNRSICPNTNKINESSNLELIKNQKINAVDYPFSCDIKICKDWVSIFSFDKNDPIGICIKNQDIANHFRLIFKLNWDLLEKDKSHLG